MKEVIVVILLAVHQVGQIEIVIGIEKGTEIVIVTETETVTEIETEIEIEIVIGVIEGIETETVIETVNVIETEIGIGIEIEIATEIWTGTDPETGHDHQTLEDLNQEQVIVTNQNLPLLLLSNRKLQQSRLPLPPRYLQVLLMPQVVTLLPQPQ